LSDDADVEQHHRSQTGQKSNTVGRRADRNTNQRWWVLRTRGQQRRDRQAPRRPETAPEEDDDASDDGGSCSMRGGGGTAVRRIGAGGRVCGESCPHSRRGITPSENPAQDAERYARVTARTPGSLGAKRTKTTEVTQTQR